VQAIPYITSRFHSTEDIGWYAATFLLAICSLQPIVGKIFSTFSIKTSYLTFVGIFMIGSLLAAVSTSSNMFIIGRTVSGVGAAGIFSGAIMIIRLIAPPAKAALYMGMATSVFGIAVVAGPVIGGAFTQHVTWRWCFYINIPVGGLTFAVLLFFFNPPDPNDKSLTFMQKLNKLDLVGCFLFIPAVVMLLFAFQWGGGRYPWHSAKIIGLFCGFGGEIIIFSIWEYFKGDEAMIPFILFRNRSLILSSIFSFLLMGSLVCFTYYLPEWFQVIKGASPGHSGVMSLGYATSQAVSSLIGGAASK
jgi:MFS family permease